MASSNCALATTSHSSNGCSVKTRSDSPAETRTSISTALTARPTSLTRQASAVSSQGSTSCKQPLVAVAHPNRSFIFASYLLPELRVARGITRHRRGIYVISDGTRIYVGQSGSIAARLTSHVASGRFSQEEINAAERYSVREARPRGRSASS